MNSHNISTSDCISSGCESGWTSYWDQLSDSRYNTNNSNQNYRGKLGGSEDEDDESMVSDASSGPRLYNTTMITSSDYSASGSQTSNPNNNKKKKKTKTKKQPQFCQLDDTATSPAFHFYQDNVDYPPPPRPRPHDQSQYKSVDHADNMPKKRLGFFKSGSKKRG